MQTNFKRIAVLASLLSLGLCNPVDAKQKAYPRFPAWKEGNWSVIDHGKQRCDANFSIGDFIALEIWGPSYSRPGHMSSGSVWHYQKNGARYSMPEGYIPMSDTPVELIAGDVRFAGSGVANIKEGWMSVDFFENGTTLDMLDGLPGTANLSVQASDKVVYSLPLMGNDAAAEALKNCTRFIEAQKRPGTKNGPALKPTHVIPPPPR